MKPLEEYLYNQTQISKVAASVNLTEQELLSKLENGSELDIVTAYKLSKALNISLDLLYKLL